MSEILKYNVTFTVNYEYISSVLEEKNITNALELAINDLKNDLKNNKKDLNDFFNVSIDVNCFYNKNKFKTKFEKQLFSFLFEKELLYMWDVKSISIKDAPFLYEDGKLTKESINNIRKLEQNVLDKIANIKKRD